MEHGSGDCRALQGLQGIEGKLKGIAGKLQGSCWALQGS